MIMTFYASSSRRDAPPPFDQTVGDVTLADIARVLRARSWIVAVGVAGGAVAYNLPPYYQAEGILVGSGAGAPPTRAEGAPWQDPPRVIAPAALRRMVEAPDRMERLAEAVLRIYLPQQNADWLTLARQRALELLGLPPERGQPAIDKMRGLLSANLTLSPEDDSGTLTLLYQNTDLRRAADISNLIMRVIAADQREVQVRNSVEMETSLEARLAALRDESNLSTRRIDGLVLRLAADAVIIRYAEGLMPSGPHVAAFWTQHFKERLMLARFGTGWRASGGWRWIISAASAPGQGTGRVRFIAWRVAMAVLPAWLLRSIPGISGSSTRL